MKLVKINLRTRILKPLEILCERFKQLARHMTPSWGTRPSVTESFDAAISKGKLHATTIAIFHAMA
jgi:hypothetical protein